MTPTPRAALASDAAAIVDLVRRAFAAQSRPTIPPSSALKETTATITAHLAHGGGAVVEFEGRLVGAGLWEDEEGGPGGGMTWMHLGVRLELEDNRRLFRPCSFEETTLHRHEGFDEPTWVRMERRLD